MASGYISFPVIVECSMNKYVDVNVSTDYLSAILSSNKPVLVTVHDTANNTYNTLFCCPLRSESAQSGLTGTFLSLTDGNIALLIGVSNNKVKAVLMPN